MPRGKATNIDWPNVIKKFIVFRRNLEKDQSLVNAERLEQKLLPLPKLSKKEMFDLFIEKTNIAIKFTSYGTLISKVKSLEDQLKIDECPICKQSKFDIFEEDGVIFTPSCNHPICAPCLAKFYFDNLRVTFILLTFILYIFYFIIFFLI